MTNDSTPLTADQIALHWCMANGYGDKKMADTLTEKINTLIAQQTAAKDARIAELEKENELLRTGKLEWAEPMGYTTYQDVLADLGKAASVRAERDALQTKLDERNAQVAMLQWQPIDTAPKEDGIVVQLKTKDGKTHFGYYGNPHSFYMGGNWVDAKGGFRIHDVTHWKDSEPDTTADAYKAELLKPWREAVATLREAIDTIYWEGQSMADYLTDEQLNTTCPKSDDAFNEALKATEGLV